jgi:hypothetical protein
MVIFTFTFTMLVKMDARVFRLAQKQNGAGLQQRVSGDVYCPIEAVAESFETNTALKCFRKCND